MEKYVFFDALRSRLAELNIPQQNIDRHMKIFEEFFKQKTADEIDKIIEGAGGIDGIVASINDLEQKKRNRASGAGSAIAMGKGQNNSPSQNSKASDLSPRKQLEELKKVSDERKASQKPTIKINTDFDVSSDDENESEKTGIFTTVKKSNTSEINISSESNISTQQDNTSDEEVKTYTPSNISEQSQDDGGINSASSDIMIDSILASSSSKVLSDDFESEGLTREIPAVAQSEKEMRDEIVAKIESEKKFADTLREQDFDNATDISEYDFEALFAETLSKPEQWIDALKGKMTADVYKYTLPVAYIAAGIILGISALLFPLCFASAIIFTVGYFASLAAGICFAIIPIGYGAYMCISSAAVGLYEIGLGIITLGITMLVCILLYNYVKRLVPFLYKQIKKLFILCLKTVKRYFKNPVKEEAK